MNSTHEKHYRIRIEQLNGEEEHVLTFEHHDREDLFKIVQKLQQSSLVSENEASKLALALRLLGPMLMQQRKSPLFAAFFPHFKQFMLTLKSALKSGSNE